MSESSNNEFKNISISTCSYYDNATQYSGGDLPAPVVVLGNTGSVLDDAWALLSQGNLPVWGSVIASSQSSGRGQTRRLWQSPKGNIYAALRLPKQAPFDDTAAAPAISALIIQVFEQWGCALNLKWPNDLVANYKKVGGILLEEKQDVIIAGIGINLKSAPENNLLRSGAMLSAGTLPLEYAWKNKLIPCNQITFTENIALHECLWLCLVKMMYFCYKAKLPVAWSELWKQKAENKLLWLGQTVSLVDASTKVKGKLKGLGTGGELVLLVDGQEQHFFNGSLEAI